MTQQDPMASLTARVVQMESDLKVLRKTFNILKALAGSQLFHDLAELKLFLQRFSQAERDFDPDRVTL